MLRKAKEDPVSGGISQGAGAWRAGREDELSLGKSPVWGAVFAGVLSFGACGSASATDEEIQVYMDEIGAVHKLSLDVHTNYAIDGRSIRDYSGQQISEGRFRVTPEFGYAVSKTVELGLYLPLANVSRDGRVSVDGVKGRIKFIAPHREEDQWYWGANLEVGYVNRSLDLNPWNGELKGIVGWKRGPWTLAANANFGFKVSGPEKAPTDAGIAAKAAYALTDKTSIGLETYNAFGPLKHPTALNRNDQQIYAVVDTALGGFDLNFGLGYGYGRPEDRFVLKAVIGVPL